MVCARSLFLIALTASAVSLLACARDAASTSAAIVNGSPASGASVVAVIHTRASGSRQLCTGTVVGPRAVLTAKHCVFEDLGGSAWTAIPTSRLTILLGDDVVGSPGEEFTVTAIDTTDGPYRDGDGAVGGDLAILTLSRDAGLPPVAIDTAAPSSGTAIRIVGFGYTEAGATGTLGTRHDGSASIVSVADGTFTSEGAAWTCTGDSGGPALDAASGRVIGVTSIGPRGCNVSSSIYTRLDRNLDLLARAGLVSSELDAAAATADAAVTPGTDAALSPGTDAGMVAPPGGGCAVAAHGPHLRGAVIALAVGATFGWGVRRRRHFARSRLPAP